MLELALIIWPKMARSASEITLGLLTGLYLIGLSLDRNKTGSGCGLRRVPHDGATSTCPLPGCCTVYSCDCVPPLWRYMLPASARFMLEHNTLTTKKNHNLKTHRPIWKVPEARRQTAGQGGAGFAVLRLTIHQIFSVWLNWRAKMAATSSMHWLD
jgi:hypothetical protein